MIVQHCHAVPHTRCRSQFWRHCGKPNKYPIITTWRVARPAHKIQRAPELVGCDNLQVICAGLLLSLNSFLASGWDSVPAGPHKYR